MMQIREKASGWTNILMCVTAFTLPLMPKFQLVFLVALLILYFFNPKKENDKGSLKLSEKWPSIGLMLLYAYYLMGLFWTENFKAAALDLQIKLPLLIFPLVILFGRLIEEDARSKIFKYFVYGLEVAVYFCLIRAGILYLNDGSNHFLYKDFSYFIHPGYFSMYLCMGSVVVLQRLFYVDNPADFKVKLLWFRLVLFTFAIVLLSSKAGIFVQILFLFVSVVLSGLHLTGRRKWNTIIPVSLVGLLIYFGIFYTATSGRMNEMQQAISNPAATEVHSSTMRMQAWESSILVILEHPLTGTGTGDSKVALLDKYLDHGFMESYNQKLNAHNQFLQTGVTLGIPAMILLISIFLLGLYGGITGKNWMLLAFLIISGLNFMVESILEVSAGAQFFGLFYVLFSYKKSD